MAQAISLPSSPNEVSSLNIDTQHDDMVHDVQLDYYGSKLATSSSDRTIKVYSLIEDTAELSATLLGHEGPVWQVSWAHPKFGVILASCSFDGSVLIHREVRPRDWMILHHARHLHESSVNSVAFGPHEHGLIVAAASSDGRVSIMTHQADNSWSTDYIADNALGVNAVSWAPAGAYSEDRPRLVTGGCDNKIRFWVQQPETGQWVDDASCPISKEVSHSDWIRDVAFAPALLPDMNMVASCSEDRSVLIWTQNGTNEEWRATLLHTFDAPVWKVSWSVSTGHILAVSSGDSDVTLWRKGIADGKWYQIDSVLEETITEGSQQDGD